MRRLSAKFEKARAWLQAWLRCSTTVATILLLAQAALVAAPVATPSHVIAGHVTTQDVVAAMVKQHLPVDHVQVAFPAGIAATVEAPVLEVGQVAMRDALSANLRMACAVHSECPSFYVVVRWPQPPGKLALDVAADAVKGSPHGVVSAQPHTLQPGAHATLLIDQAKVHIRLPVICTQSGGVGDRIRVVTTNRRQSYEAVVLTETEVQGSL